MDSNAAGFLPEEKKLNADHRREVEETVLLCPCCKSIRLLEMLLAEGFVPAHHRQMSNDGRFFNDPMGR
jgi:hypothetical protein